MKRKTAAVLAAACLALCLIFAGCGIDLEAYPPIEPVNIEAEELATSANSTFSVQYPAGKWTGTNDTAPLIIYYSETMDSNRAVNVNVQRSGTYGGKFTEKEMNQLAESLVNSPSSDLKSAELRSLNGKSIICIESSTRITDESLDLLLEQGVITQADIDAAGGRDALLATPPADQVTLYAVRGAYLYIYTGTYYEESQKDDVLECINVLIQTTEEVK